MKSETLVHRHPITPPSVHPELQALNQIAQYIADRRYSVEDVHNHGSAYGSPGPGMHDVNHAGPYQNSHGEDFGLGIQYDGYGHGPTYYQEGSYNGLPSSQGMVSGSSLTPSSAFDEEAERRTRSGRIVMPCTPPQSFSKSFSKPRTKASPRVRKAKAAKGDKPKTPKLTKALSILTKDMTNIPVRNMEEWVNRSVETRRKEVEKRNGYVTRPMNSFMLYRSAYAERTKQWCLQNNHQIVSSVSGESWPMEPPEIRELYNEYAKIERMNHQNAHPNYKFSPSKAVAPPKKRKDEFSDDEPSDLEDAAWSPSHGRVRSRSAKRQDRSIGYPSHAMDAEFFDRSFGSNGNGMNKSAWEMTNAGRPMPMPMQNDLYNHFYQQNMHQNMGMQQPVMELQRVDNPNALQYSSGHAMLGLPGGNAADMMQHLHSHVGTPLGDEGQVDPMLLAFDGGRHQEMDPNMVPQPDFRNGHLSMVERELDQDSVHSFLGTEPSQDDYPTEHWQHDPHMAALEHGSEFEKWMDDGHAA